MLLGSSKIPARRVTFRLLFEPRDAWVGVFWNHVVDLYWAPPRFSSKARFLLIYICLIPCLPVVIAVRRERVDR